MPQGFQLKISYLDKLSSYNWFIEVGWEMLWAISSCLRSIQEYLRAIICLLRASIDFMGYLLLVMGYFLIFMGFRSYKNSP